MASFTLTAANGEILLGLDTEADIFTVPAAGRLVGADTLRGGINAHSDILRVSATFALAAADFANTRDFERLQILAAGGATVTLDDAMVASTDRVDFQVLGGAGGDTVYGGNVLATQLLMQGEGGNDLMESGGGNDILRAGIGADTMIGGAGADTIEIALTELGTTDRLDGGDGNDVLRLTGTGGNIGAAHFAALSNIERIELAVGVAQALTVNVGAGYTLGGGSLTVLGGTANDKFVATGASLGVVFLGEFGDDTLVGGGFADSLSGGAGNDLINANAGNDTADGGLGNDRISGGAGNDLLIGYLGNDTISGGAGADTIEAGDGTDRLDGGTGNDLYRFQTAVFDLTDFVVDEDGNLDVLEFTGAASMVVSGALAARISGIERFILGSGNDTFAPGNTIGDSAALAPTVEGGEGNDVLDLGNVTPLLAPPGWRLLGGDGADSLVGGYGADTLDQGAGDGLMRGGAGNDLLIMQAADVALIPTIDGGTGIADVLRIVGGGTIGPIGLLITAGWAGTIGVEIVELSPEGNEVVLVDGMVTGADLGAVFTVRGNSGDDTVASSLVGNGVDLRIELGAGDDLVVGGGADETVLPGTGADTINLGAGFDRVEFLAGELSGLDVVGADTLDGDTMVITLAANRTLPSTVFANVTGFDTFLLDAPNGPAAVRLPSNLVSLSGQANVTVDIIAQDHGVVVDGRSVSGALNLIGGLGNDLLLGTLNADTLNGVSGEDTLVGGDGGDTISLGSGGTDRDLALIVSQFDGTIDMNGAVAISAADRVTGLAHEGNYIAVDAGRLGLPGTSTFFLSAGASIQFGWGANVLVSTEEIAGNSFGSLAAVQAVVGNRLTGGTAGVNDRIILVIGGADETEFGVYFFEDRDDNSTINTADLLYLLAIGDTDVPTFNSGHGFTLDTLDVV
jgi:Ca2+-binding RTX toxin-like protein